MTAAGTRAIELVRRAGIDHRVHAYGLEAERHGRARATRPAFGLEAAAALGVAPAAPILWNRPSRNERPATSSVGSARWALGGSFRRLSMRVQARTRRSSCRPDGAACSSNWPRPIWPG